jgi:hypothetical protein
MDTTGDGCCTEDITDIVVSNDDAGTISFAITEPPGTYEWSDSSDRFIGIVTERARFTIGTNDYPSGYFIGRWEPDVRRPVGWAQEGDVLRVWLDRHLLGDTDRFSFHVEYWNAGTMHAIEERAPDSGEWSYAVKIAPARIDPILRVRQHAPGATLAARLALQVGRSDRLLASGHISCTATVGGRRLRPKTPLYSERQALCLWGGAALGARETRDGLGSCARYRPRHLAQAPIVPPQADVSRSPSSRHQPHQTSDVRELTL